METGIDDALKRCIDKPGVPQYIDKHDWPVRLLLQPDESKTLDVQTQLKDRSLLLCCCSLGGGLPFVPGIVLQRKIVVQFCRRRKCTHYGLIAEEYSEGVSNSWTSEELEYDVVARYFDILKILVRRYQVSSRTSILSADALFRQPFSVRVFNV